MDNEDAPRMRRLGDMSEEQRNLILENAHRNIILEGADALTVRGFTIVPNYILDARGVSALAKFAYAILLKYAWEKDFCYPGQETMANDMCVGVRSVRNYLHELEKAGFIEIRQQGQGKPNLYVLKMKRIVRDRQNLPVKTGKKR